MATSSCAGCCRARPFWRSASVCWRRRRRGAGSIRSVRSRTASPTPLRPARTRKSATCRCFRVLWADEALHRLRTHPHVLALFDGIFGEPALAHPMFVQRNIFPQSESFDFTTGEHQDKVHIGGATSHAMWVPLGDCPREKGALAVAAGSHRAGVLDTRVGGGAGGMDICVPIPGEWVSGSFGAGDALIFSDTTVHRALPNRSTELRQSFDARYQPASQPVAEPNMLPYSGCGTWEEVYAGWSSDDQKYYWKALSPNVVPFDRSYYERRDRMAFAMAESGDATARDTLLRIAQRDPNAEKRRARGRTPAATWPERKAPKASAHRPEPPASSPRVEASGSGPDDPLPGVRPPAAARRRSSPGKSERWGELPSGASGLVSSRIAYHHTMTGRGRAMKMQSRAPGSTPVESRGRRRSCPRRNGRCAARALARPAGLRHGALALLRSALGEPAGAGAAGGSSRPPPLRQGDAAREPGRSSALRRLPGGRARVRHTPASHLRHDRSGHEHRPDARRRGPDGGGGCTQLSDRRADHRQADGPLPQLPDVDGRRERPSRSRSRGRPP